MNFKQLHKPHFATVLGQSIEVTSHHECGRVEVQGTRLKLRVRIRAMTRFPPQARSLISAGLASVWAEQPDVMRRDFRRLRRQSLSGCQRPLPVQLQNLIGWPR